MSKESANSKSSSPPQWGDAPIVTGGNSTAAQREATPSKSPRTARSSGSDRISEAGIPKKIEPRSGGDGVTPRWMTPRKSDVMRKEREDEARRVALGVKEKPKVSYRNGYISGFEYSMTII